MANPCDLIIFGATGDLAIRKLLPALYRAFKEDSLSRESKIFLTCRSEEQIDNYQNKLERSMVEFLSEEEFESALFKEFVKLLEPTLLDIKNTDKGWRDLGSQLSTTRDRVFYLSIAPALYAECCMNLSNFDLISENSRVVLEKPIGYDQNSANEINTQVGNYFKEEQIFRIDHYLGKETVQNLMVLRFTNLLFENMWDRQSIDHIQISISETVGLEGRAGFYNDAGAMRDMVQNHLLQLLCLIAMEPPNQLNGDSIRTEKIKVLKALRSIKDGQVKTETVRGQYASGSQSGQELPSYLEELGSDESSCETFVAIRAFVDNWRWRDVPFYLRTGKRLKTRCAEIVVQFKPTSHSIYGAEFGYNAANRLTIQLQPDETIQLSLTSKKLDCKESKLREAVLDLNLNNVDKRIHSDAYKRLLLDVIANDPSLFIHREEIDNAWAWVDPIIEGWKLQQYEPELYKAGSWGPVSSDRLIEDKGHSWFNGIC